jgi:hypothetical protein
MLQGLTNIPVEFGLNASCSYPDIFNAIEVDVVFSERDGEEWKVPAFWAGGNAFRVRFAAPRPGRYAYRSVCTNAEDQGLHGQAGELEIAACDQPGSLFEHGRLRVATSRRTLEHEDGVPFLWLADTWWAALSPRLEWPDGFEMLTLDRVDKGFNVIQVVVGPLPDFDAATASWDPQQANEAGWPWEKEWRGINPGFYDLADARIASLIAHGLMPCIVGMWGYYLPFMGVENVRRHWRNLVARYAAYPVVWCMAGESSMQTYSLWATEEGEAHRALLVKEWTEVTRYVREVDPFHNVITIHPPCDPPDSRSMITDESLLDLEMLQTGHSGYQSLKPTVEQVKISNAQQPRMPVLIGEVCYEGIMGGSREEIQRFLFWTSLTIGSAGHSYGAQGMWQMSSRDEPFRGTTNSWGDGFWQDVMHYAGAAQMGVGRRFFERYPWWLFEPRPEPQFETSDRFAAFATGIPGAVVVYYLPGAWLEETLRGVQGSPWGPQTATVTIEPDAAYRAFFFNPRTGEDVRSAQADGGEIVALDRVVPDADGLWLLPPKPTMDDWVLVLEDTDALAACRKR